jgi:hypothetical protein
METHPQRKYTKDKGATVSSKVGAMMTGDRRGWKNSDKVKIVFVIFVNGARK